MSVERDVVLTIASAEMNDEYGVDFDYMGAREALTASEAREIAGELIAAADEAEAAAEHYVLSRPVATAGFDVEPVAGARFGGDVQVHDVRQAIPWPPFQEATYLLSRFDCCCGWHGTTFRDIHGSGDVEAARAQASAHLGRPL